MKKFIYSFAIGLLLSVNSCMADTLTVYSNSSGDGDCENATANQSFSTKRGGNGTVCDASFTEDYVNLYTYSSGGNYSTMVRLFFPYDTSAITSSNVVSSATASFSVTLKTTGLGQPDLHISGQNQASNTALAASDFQTAQDTSFGSKAYANITTDGSYVDIPLNSSGISAISKTGYTKLMARNQWDMNNTTTGITWAATTGVLIGIRMSNYTGTSSDPKLVVEHSSAFTPSTIIISDNGQNKLMYSLNTIYIQSKHMIAKLFTTAYAHE